MFGTKTTQPETKNGQRSWLGSVVSAGQNMLNAGKTLYDFAQLDFTHLEPLAKDLSEIFEQRIENEFRTQRPSPNEYGLYNIETEQSYYRQYLLHAQNVCNSILKKDKKSLARSVYALTKNPEQNVANKNEYYVLNTLRKKIEHYLEENPLENPTHTLLIQIKVSLEDKVRQYAISHWEKIQIIFDDIAPAQHREIIQQIEKFFDDWHKNTKKDGTNSKGEQLKNAEQAVASIENHILSLEESYNEELYQTTTTEITQWIDLIQKMKEANLATLSHPIYIDHSDSLEVLANASKKGLNPEELEKLDIIQTYYRNNNPKRTDAYGRRFARTENQLQALKERLTKTEEDYIAAKEEADHQARLKQEQEQKQKETYASMQRMFDEADSEALIANEIIKTIIFKDEREHFSQAETEVNLEKTDAKDRTVMTFAVSDDSLILNKDQTAILENTMQSTDHQNAFIDFRHRQGLPLIVTHTPQNCTIDAFAKLHASDDAIFIIEDKQAKQFDRNCNALPLLLNSLSNNDAVKNDIATHLHSNDLLLFDNVFGHNDEYTFFSKEGFTVQKNETRSIVIKKESDNTISVRTRKFLSPLTWIERTINEDLIRHYVPSKDSIGRIETQINLSPKLPNSSARNLQTFSISIENEEALPYILRCPIFYTAEILSKIKPQDIPAMVSDYNSQHSDIPPLPTCLLDFTLTDYLRLLRANPEIYKTVEKLAEKAEKEPKKDKIKIFHIGHQLLASPEKLPQATIDATILAMTRNFDLAVALFTKPVALDNSPRDIPADIYWKQYVEKASPEVQKSYIRVVMNNQKTNPFYKLGDYIRSGKDFEQQNERRNFVMSNDKSGQYLKLYIQSIIENDTKDAPEKAMAFIRNEQNKLESLNLVIQWDRTGKCIQALLNEATFIESLALTQEDRDALIAFVKNKKREIPRHHRNGKYNALANLVKKLSKSQKSDSDKSDDESESILTTSSPKRQGKMPSEVADSLSHHSRLSGTFSNIDGTGYLASETNTHQKDDTNSNIQQTTPIAEDTLTRGLTDREFEILTNYSVSKTLSLVSRDVICLIKATAISYDDQANTKTLKTQHSAFLRLINHHKHPFGLNYLQILKNDKLNLNENLIELVATNTSLINKYLPKRFKKKTIRNALKKVFTQERQDNTSDAIFNNTSLLKKINFKLTDKKLKQAEKESLYTHILAFATTHTDRKSNDRLFDLFGKSTLRHAIIWLSNQGAEYNQMRADLHKNQDLLKVKRHKIRKNRSLGYYMSKSRIHGRKGQPYGNLIKLPEAPPKNARPPFGSQGDITHGLSIPANSTGIEAETHERRLSADSAGSGSGGTASEDEAGHLLSAMPSPANPTNPDIKKPKGKRAANATPAEPQKTQFSARG